MRLHSQNPPAPTPWRALRAPQAALAFCSKGLAERCVILENSGTSFSQGAARCVQTPQLGTEYEVVRARGVTVVVQRILSTSRAGSPWVTGTPSNVRPN